MRPADNSAGLVLSCRSSRLIGLVQGRYEQSHASAGKITLSISESPDSLPRPLIIHDGETSHGCKAQVVDHKMSHNDIRLQTSFYLVDDWNDVLT